MQLSVVQTFQLGLVCGAAAGFTVDAVLFPLDTLKTRLQLAGGASTSGGTAALLRGLYNGFAPAVVASAPAAATFFATYDYVKSELEDKVQYKPIAHMLAAAAADVTSSTVRVPFEVVKQQLQSGLHGGSVRNAVSGIFQSKGIAGFMSGYGSLVLRELPFDALQFPLWEFFKARYAKIKGADLTTIESSACGSAAGAIAASITTPLDVVKTRLMTQVPGGPQYNGVVHGLQKIAREEGVAALFSGIAPRVMWISLGGFLYFGAYEATRKVMFPVVTKKKESEDFLS